MTACGAYPGTSLYVSVLQLHLIPLTYADTFFFFFGIWSENTLPSPRSHNDKARSDFKLLFLDEESRAHDLPKITNQPVVTQGYGTGLRFYVLRHQPAQSSTSHASSGEDHRQQVCGLHCTNGYDLPRFSRPYSKHGWPSDLQVDDKVFCCLAPLTCQTQTELTPHA